MKSRRLGSLFMLLLLLSSTVGIVNSQDMSIGAQVQILTVGVEESVYEPGEFVEIFGTAESHAKLTVFVFDRNTKIFDINVTAEEDGGYWIEIDLPEDAKNGTYTVIVSTEYSSIQDYFYVMFQDFEEIAENLISTAKESQESVEDLLQVLEENGIDVPKGAIESYNLGILALDAAIANYEDGNFSEAVDFAYEAVKHMGNVFRQLNDLISPKSSVDDDEVIDENGEGPQNLYGIKIALDRAYEYWRKLDETVARFDEDGYDVSGINEALDDAAIVLDVAAGHVNAGDFAAAREEFTRARSNLGRINGLLQSMVKVHKKRQANQFMENFQRRISYMNGTIVKIRENLEGVKAQNFEYLLNETSERLQKLRVRLSQDDLEDVLDELDDTVEDVEDGLDELNGRGFSIQIKNVNIVEATIKTLNITTERLRRRGWDTSDTEEELEDAESLLNDLKGLLEEGEIESVNDFLDDVKARFDDLKNELNKENLENNQISIAQKYSEEAISSIWNRLQERKQSYDEFKEKLVSLTETLQGLTQRGLNISDIQRYLQLAREKLGEALTQYDLDPDLYEKLIYEVNSLIEKAKSLIEEIIINSGASEVDVTGTNRNKFGMNDTVVSSDSIDVEPDDSENTESTNSTVAANG